MKGSPHADLAEVAAGYEALRHGCGAYELVRDVVAVQGPDATGYLQGQVSQDVEPLTVGESVAALVLEPDGKLCALVRVTRTEANGYLLDTDRGFGEAVAARLRRFRLRTKVEIVAASWPCVALRGDRVPLSVPAGGGDDDPGRDTGDGRAAGTPLVLPVEWNGTRGLDRLGPGAADGVPGGAHRCGAPSWEALRVEAGIPAMGSELDERTIAAEAGLVTRAVSFTKGCYTGQELVARLDARGNRVARRLSGIVTPGVDPADATSLAGADLWVHGRDKPVGRCTSAAWCPGLGSVAGLAYLHRSVEVPAELAWTPGASVAAASGAASGVSGQRLAEARSLPMVQG